MEANKGKGGFNDSFDINELASLNDDFSVEFIEQLQNQVSQSAGIVQNKDNNSDANLFEDIVKNSQDNSGSASKKVEKLNEDIDDNFIKKYKAKLNKQKLGSMEPTPTPKPTNESKEDEEQIVINNIKLPSTSNDIKQAEFDVMEQVREQATEQFKNKGKNIQEIRNALSNNHRIEHLTGGNITEQPLSPEQSSYAESLDYLDDNVKYSKYVIYINPENIEFIESLTVKERKNLINKILKEQDDIAITKKRFNTIQSLIKHIIVAIITISISIPVIYTVINASLEASINNHRRSQTIFKTLYREKGKIRSNINR